MHVPVVRQHCAQMEGFVSSPQPIFLPNNQSAKLNATFVQSTIDDLLNAGGVAEIPCPALFNVIQCDHKSDENDPKNAEIRRSAEQSHPCIIQLIVHCSIFQCSMSRECLCRLCKPLKSIKLVTFDIGRYL